MVLSAVGTVASGALSGAGGEMGRRTSERLYDLLRRGRTGDGAAGAGGGTSGSARAVLPALPVTESERAAVALLLTEGARSSPEFARDVTEWVREASWLAPRAVPAVAQGASRPRMLPPATAVFTDRADVLAWVTALLSDDASPDNASPEAESRVPGAPTTAVLTGPGGIGKTAAAVQCAFELGERFPDGVLFADLNGASAGTALPPSDVLARFLERLGVPPGRVPGDEARQRDLYRDCTADRRMIVVLDNAHDDAQVIPLLPASPGCLVLVTSRHRLGRLVAGYGARPFALGPLSTEDSVSLIRRVVGGDRPAAPDAVVRAVAEGTGGIPLAVCTTGAGLAVREHLTWERVARQLSDRLRGPDQEGSAMGEGTLEGPGATADPVRLAQEVAYGELTPACAAFYRAIAVWAWPTVTVLCAAHAAGVGEDEARELLEQLARVHLLEEVGEERYRFHDLTRAHARELAVTEDGHVRMAAAVRRVAVAHLRFAARADLRVMPLRWRLGPAYRGIALPRDRDRADGKHALAELRAERENLAAVIRAAAHHGLDDLVWQLCEAMWGLHLLLGFHAQWIDTHLLGVEAARRGAAEFGDPRAVGRMAVQLAFGHMELGRAADAEAALVRARAADQACGHHRGEATAVEVLGLLRLRQWEFGAAQRCFEEAQEILGRIGPGEDGWEDVPRATALLEHHIGRARTKQGQSTAAVARLNDALAQFRRLPGGDPYNEGRVYMSLGDAHLAAGDVELARVCLDEAVEAMTEAGAGLQLADAVLARARCHRSAGLPAQEAEDLRTAEACFEENRDSTGLEQVRARLAELAA
ncbi:tetratricopeptide repeat protein [Streptomyces sp. CWNU-52B]|uniref:tetratricopeptide repeat protein n=1 Tax=unclassified Streptomyces TaxID=2593676 RepID=UPI0039C3FEF5